MLWMLLLNIILNETLIYILFGKVGVTIFRVCIYIIIFPIMGYLFGIWHNNINKVEKGNKMYYKNILGSALGWLSTGVVMSIYNIMKLIKG